MSIRTFLYLGIILASASAPSFAQHSGHGGGSGHGGHGSKQDHSGHQQESPKKITATNKICPVKGREVKPGRDRQVVVGGNPYLVCGDGCGPEMAEHKEKYLDKDGKPLNAPKSEPQKDSEKGANKKATTPAVHEGHSD